MKARDGLRFTVHGSQCCKTVNRQPSTVNREPSAQNRQPSTVNRQPLRQPRADRRTAFSRPRPILTFGRLDDWTFRRGFTLVELVATIVVLAIIGSVSAGIIFTATDGYVQASTAAALHEEASLAMDRMSRALREISRDGAAPVPHINEVGPDSIRWHDDSELVLENESLMLVIDGGPPATLANDVSVFSVRTFDEDNQPLPTTMSGSDCHDIRRIELTLTLSRHGESETLRMRVFVRAAMTAGGGP
jgi:prepilin-type N-terminal cleavage/methylation domain-containing protein